MGRYPSIDQRQRNLEPTQRHRFADPCRGSTTGYGKTRAERSRVSWTLPLGIVAKTHQSIKTGRSTAIGWALPLGLAATVGASLMAGACGSKFTSCEEQETCEGPDSKPSPDPKGQGGQGGAGSDATCAQDPGLCSEHATCKTTDGVTSCVCDDGYEGDGLVCDDIDECAEGDGPCDENATCANTPGSFECTCNEGFFGTGTECWPLTDLVSAGEDGSEIAENASLDVYMRPALSASGQVIAYASGSQVFVRDYRMGTNTLLSARPDGSAGQGYAPSISADGNLVLFNSGLGDLAGDQGLSPAMYLRDLAQASTQYVSHVDLKAPWGFHSHMSSDGRHIAFITDGIRVKNLTTGVETRPELKVADQDLRVSAYDGRLQLSADGRYVAFTPGSDIYVHDLSTKLTTLASVSTSAEPADRGAYAFSLSGDGRFVAFGSLSTNLTPHPPNDHAQVYVRDLVAGTTTLVSVNSLGMPGNGGSADPSLSHDGRFVAFQSSASDLVVGDTNGVGDIFVRDLVEGVTVRVSVSSLGEQANASSGSPVISADGRVVAFTSRASNLAPGASGERRQVYRRVFRPE